MIPVSLTMQAFGPYGGVEKIDFTKFYNNRLFLITGNTGSGKTIIFDAICYALFGEASGEYRRVDSFKSQFSDKSIVSYVEFEFIHKNKKYIIRREPPQVKISRGVERNEKRQNAKIIFDDDIITKVTEVDNKVKDILGINYTQFKQIVMIAQGEFRKLVSADSKERETIYRRIFNTMNFESIQNFLKVKASELDKKFSFLDEKIKGSLDSIQHIKQISYEEFTLEQIFKILDDEIEIYNSNIKDEAHKKEILQKDFDLHRDLFNKFNELFELEKQFREIDVPKLKQEKIYLENVERANIISVDEEKFNNSEKKYKDAINEKNLLDNDLNISKNKLNSYDLDFKNQEFYNLEIQNLNNKILELENLKNVIDEKFKLESDILNEKNNLNLFNSKFKSTIEKIESLENRKNEIITFQNQYGDINLEISNMEIRSSHLEMLKNSFVKYHRELTLYNEDLLKYEKMKPNYNEVFNLYNEKSTKLIEAEEIYLRNQAGILAKKLTDNSPCMVCGSKIHPKKAELFNESIDEIFIKNLKSELKKLEEVRNEINSETSSLNNKILVRKSTLEEIYNELLLKDKDNEFIIFSIFDSDGELLDKLNNIILNFKNDIENNKKINEKILDFKNQLLNIENDLKIIQNEKDEINKSIIKTEANISSMIFILSEKNEKLQKFSIQTKDDYTNILNNLKHEYKILVEKMDVLKNNIKKCNDEIISLNGKIEIKNKEVEKLHNEVVEYKENFFKAITENGFSNIEEYLKYKLTQEEFRERRKFLEDKRDEYRTLKSKIDNLKLNFKDSEMREKNDFEIKLNDLNRKIKEIENSERYSLERRALLNNAKKNIMNLSEEKSKSEKYRTDLNELNKISNGDNKQKISFERYILGIYFKEIIAAANVRFLKLTNGRFLLRHSKENIDSRVQQGLNISVFDNYTSSERQINTLSGGQSFEAALSLALGLSDVVQRYSGGISIDTLFIDEGFGSLDSDSIQNALECLIDVNDKSKLIGIISHVQELKDFIKFKIEVLDSTKGSKIKINV